MNSEIINKLSNNSKVFISIRKIIEWNFFSIKKLIYKQLYQVGSNEKILDLGCGTGEFSSSFTNYQYTGIDTDPNYISYAKNKYGRDFRVMNGKSLLFKDNTFSMIIVIGVLHHLSNNSCKDIFGEMKRVLKTNGKIIIIEDVNPESKYDYIGNWVRKADKGDYIRTKKEWAQLISSDFSIINNFQIRSFIPTYEVFIISTK